MLKVTRVDEDSIASSLGFEEGDVIESINGEEQNDLMDFTYAESGEFLEITVLTRQGERVTVEIEKDGEESLGLSFGDDLLEPNTCKNNCSFCFVAQLPKGMRRSLYVKDDDWRLSCICGNYVTLTNVSDREFERILKLGVSPLYVSVHAYTPEVRVKLMKNPETVKLFDRLERLSKRGIRIHAQIVMCKGINDGEELRLTLSKLYEIENVLSVAVVPVGLTGFREGLEHLDPIDRETAREAIEIANSAGERGGQAFAYCSDEMYLRAEVDVPDYEYYGNFCQIENGVGMIASFLHEVDEALLKEAEPTGSYSLITGVSARKTLELAVDKICARYQGITLKVIAKENEFFGPSITVTGLLTGSDIEKAINGDESNNTVIIPSVTMREGEQTFLDDMTLDELRQRTGRRIIVADSSRGSGLVEAILTEE